MHSGSLIFLAMSDFLKTFEIIVHGTVIKKLQVLNLLKKCLLQNYLSDM